MLLFSQMSLQKLKKQFLAVQDGFTVVEVHLPGFTGTARPAGHRKTAEKRKPKGQLFRFT